MFGADPFNSTEDPFKSDASDPFSAPASTENNYENSKTIQESDASDSDPFGNSFTANFSSAPVPNRDPFGSSSFSNDFGSSNDPFSLTNLKPITSSSVSDASLAKSSPAVSTTTNTVSYRKEKLSSDSSAVSEKSLKKKPSHSLSDFLTGSPLKLDKGEKKEKKEKKSGKFHLTSPLKTHKKESPTADKKSKSFNNEKESDEVNAKSS